MKSIHLVFPTPEMEAKVLSFKNAFLENGERTIPGSYKLDQDRYTYEMWLDIITRNLTPETANPKFGTSETYFAEDECGELVGILNFRHTLTPFYANSGHIGLSVVPAARRQGYATAMLQSALGLAAKAGIREIRLVCNTTNIGSRKTILACGGALSRTFVVGEASKEEYIITL